MRSQTNNKFEEIFNELVAKQRKNISSDRKLQIKDIKRIAYKLSESIDHPLECSIWNGYITHNKNIIKGSYINFYFRKKKVALHRLLYINYVGNIGANEYLKFTCESKGNCCNIRHIAKFKYNTIKKNISDSEDRNLIDDQTSILSNNSEDLILEFE